MFLLVLQSSGIEEMKMEMNSGGLFYSTRTYLSLCAKRRLSIMFIKIFVEYS